MEWRGTINTRLKQCTAYADDILLTTRTKRSLVDTFHQFLSCPHISILQISSLWYFLPVPMARMSIFSLEFTASDFRLSGLAICSHHYTSILWSQTLWFRNNLSVSWCRYIIYFISILWIYSTELWNWPFSSV